MTFQNQFHEILFLRSKLESGAIAGAGQHGPSRKQVEPKRHCKPVLHEGASP